MADVQDGGQGGVKGLQAEMFGQLDDASDQCLTLFRRFPFMARQRVGLVDNADSPVPDARQMAREGRVHCGLRRWSRSRSSVSKTSRHRRDHKVAKAKGGYDYLLEFVTRNVSHYQSVTEGSLERVIGTEKYLS